MKFTYQCTELAVGSIIYVCSANTRLWAHKCII